MAIKLLDISVLASAADDAERCELSEGRVGVGSPNLQPGSSAAGESSVVCDEPGAEHEQECTTRCCQLSQIAVGEYPDRPMLGAADKHFITRLRGTSPAIETPSAIQLSPPMPPLVLHALKRVRLRLVWQVLGVLRSTLGMDSSTVLPYYSMCKRVHAFDGRNGR